MWRCSLPLPGLSGGFEREDFHVNLEFSGRGVVEKRSVGCGLILPWKTEVAVSEDREVTAAHDGGPDDRFRAGRLAELHESTERTHRFQRRDARRAPDGIDHHTDLTA